MGIVVFFVAQLDSQSADVQGVDSPVATGVNEKIQVLPDLLESRSPVLRDPQVHHFGALCVPDTYDSQQGTSILSNFLLCYLDNEACRETKLQNWFLGWN